MALICREAQCISYADVTFEATTSRSRVMPCLLGDGMRIKGVIVSHGLLPTDGSVDTCADTLPLSGRTGDRRVNAVRNMDVNCDGFKEYVYLIWLGRRLHLQYRGAGQQVDVAFRPGDAIKVSLYGRGSKLDKQ